MKRIAIVSPRYGVEVTSGAARYARQIAEKLVQRYEVDVLTTKAVDDSTWRNWYARDVENLKGVTVRRFNVLREKAGNLDAYTSTYLQECKEDKKSVAIEKIWIEKYGPYAPDCIRYIMHHKQDYDVIIFVGYMHYLTVAGMPEAAQKAVLIPLIEGESPCFQFITFQQMFTMPKAFLFLTDEERMLVRKKFRTQGIPCEVMGTGADVPDDIDERGFYHKYQIRDTYIVYAGKISEDKDCPQLFHYFTEYRRRNPQIPLKLVLMGKEICPVPEHEDIISLGFVSDHDKFSGIAGAAVLVSPCPHENMPDAVMSAMALGVPVLVNGACGTLRELCVKSNGGLYYENFFEFEGALNVLMTRDDVYSQLSRNERVFIKRNYQWDVIIENFMKLMKTAVVPEEGVLPDHMFI